MQIMFPLTWQKSGLFEFLCENDIFHVLKKESQECGTSLVKINRFLSSSKVLIHPVRFITKEHNFFNYSLYLKQEPKLKSLKCLMILSKLIKPSFLCQWQTPPANLDISINRNNFNYGSSKKPYKIIIICQYNLLQNLNSIDA